MCLSGFLHVSLYPRADSDPDDLHKKLFKIRTEWSNDTMPGGSAKARVCFLLGMNPELHLQRFWLHFDI